LRSIACFGYLAGGVLMLDGMMLSGNIDTAVLTAYSISYWWQQAGVDTGELT
jgi:hypothetical protein